MASTVLFGDRQRHREPGETDKLAGEVMNSSPAKASNPVGKELLVTEAGASVCPSGLYRSGVFLIWMSIYEGISIARRFPGYRCRSWLKIRAKASEDWGATCLRLA